MILSCMHDYLFVGDSVLGLPEDARERINTGSVLTVRGFWYAGNVLGTSGP